MSQISAFDPVDAAITSRAENRFNSMTSEEFIQIMFTELSNQDPFQPNDSGALLEQLSSIRSIESNINLMEHLETLVLESQLASAANMIGKTITGLTSLNDRVTGEVVSVLREGEEITLELSSGERVPIGSVQSIVASPTTSPGPVS